MKATLKKLTGQQQTFDDLLTEARALHKDLYAANTFNDARDEKLTAKAYLAEALKNARTTLKVIEELDKKVAALPEIENEHLLVFLAEVQKGAMATRMDQGVNLRPPNGNLHRFMFGYQAPEYTACVVEANLAGTNPFELVALAAYRATRECPECFGVIEDWNATDKNRTRFDEVCAQIGLRWREAERDIGDPGADSRAMITIQGVPVFPVESLGARLAAL